MQLAREINKRLDEILAIEDEIQCFEKEIDDGGKVVDTTTGEEVSKEEALNKAKQLLSEIKIDLNKLTNGGQNCVDVFTNPYYVNDMSMDRALAREATPSERPLSESAPNNDTYKPVHIEEQGDGKGIYWKNK